MNTNRVGSSIQEVELEASLNAKADELIQAQIAIERHTSEIATLSVDTLLASTYSKTSTYDASIDPATSARNLLHFDEQRNVFEHFRMQHRQVHWASKSREKLFFLLLSSIVAALYFARMASGNGKWRMLGFVYIIIVLSYAFLRMLY